MALFGQYLLSSVAQQFALAISSDEATALALTDADTLLLAISQSGETFDTLHALRRARDCQARTAAIVNVPGSSMTREAEVVILQDSGPEICVISTKAAMAQMALLLRLAVELADLKLPSTSSERLQILKELASCQDFWKLC
jgi:glutamine---fructose-6-phosphate transaminase (isomerizing)